MLLSGLLVLSVSIGLLVGYSTATFMLVDAVRRRDWHDIALGALQLSVALLATAMLPNVLKVA